MVTLNRCPGAGLEKCSPTSELVSGCGQKLIYGLDGAGLHIFGGWQDLEGIRGGGDVGAGMLKPHLLRKQALMQLIPALPEGKCNYCVNYGSPPLVHSRTKCEQLPFLPQPAPLH